MSTYQQFCKTVFEAGMENETFKAIQDGLQQMAVWTLKYEDRRGVVSERPICPLKTFALTNGDIEYRFQALDFEAGIVKTFKLQGVLDLQPELREDGTQKCAQNMPELLFSTLASQVEDTPSRVDEFSFPDGNGGHLHNTEAAVAAIQSGRWSAEPIFLVKKARWSVSRS